MPLAELLAIAYPGALAMERTAARYLLAAIVIAASSCVPGAGTGPAVPGSGILSPLLPVPEEVTAENLPLALRRLDDLEATSEQHGALRASVIHQLNLRFEAEVSEGRIDDAAGTFRTAIGTFGTEEILAGEMAPEVASMARTMKERFSPIGDEAKVMVALLVLISVHPDDAELREEYETLVRWTEEARKSLKDDAMRIIDLAGLYEEVAESLPLPSITSRLLGLYRERETLSREAYSKMLSFDPSKGVEGLMEAAEATQLYEYLQPQVRRTSYLVARLFTRIGTPTSALAVLESDFADATGGSMQNQIHVEVLLVLGALEDDPGNPGHWLALGRLLARNDDTDLARWAMRRGWSLEPSDATFPLEIGLSYRSSGDLGGAEEYLELALSLDENKPAVFQNLIALHADVARTALEAHDAEAASASLDSLAPLLRRFEERWPNAASEVTPAGLQKLRGLVALEKGDAKEAAERFQSSLADVRDMETFLLLGRLQMLTGDFAGADGTIDRALKVPIKKHGEAYYWKSILTTLKGDVLHLAGKDEEASSLWRQALDTGMEALPFVPLGLKPDMEARLGLLLHRLGRNAPAIDHLKRSIAGGAKADTYAMVLAYLTARGDQEVGDVFYHYAATESNLTGEDQVTFAAWNVALHWRAGSEADARAREMLASVETAGWPGPLAHFASGTATFTEARAQAGPPHDVPLLYLGACQLLGQGDVKGAAVLLRELLGEGRVADPHHAMALETLRSIEAAP
jgi:tetratricopeptide (TPR) repeat protein